MATNVEQLGIRDLISSKLRKMTSMVLRPEPDFQGHSELRKSVVMQREKKQSIFSWVLNVQNWTTLSLGPSLRCKLAS